MNFNLLIHVKKNEISKYTKNSQLKRKPVEKSKPVQGGIFQPPIQNKHPVILKRSAHYAK